MAKKKSSKKEVQTTLGDIMAEDDKPKKKAVPKKKTTSKKSKSTRSTAKTSTKKAAEKKASSKKTSKSSKKSSSKKETSTKKAPKKKETTKKSSAKKSTKKEASTTTSKKATKKKPSKKRKKPSKPKLKLEGPSLTTLSGVGSKMEEKLIEAGYNSIGKIAKSRADAMSRKVEGLSKSGASKLIADAKSSLSSDKPTSAEESPDDEIKIPSLTELPGVGGKVAKALEAAGYNSISRLARAQPSGLAQRVDGLGEQTAKKIVAEAQKYVREQEKSIIMGEEEEEPRTVTASKRSSKKPTSKKSKKEKKAKEDKPKDEAEEVASESKPTEEKKPTKKKEKPPVRKKKTKKPPQRTKPKIVRKSSGLKVPDAVARFAKEMKETWKEVERMEAEGTLPTDLPETVEVLNLEAPNTISRLVETAQDVLNEALVTGRPTFEIPSRSSDNIVWDEFRDLLLLGMKTINRPYHSLASVVDATRTARVMEIIYQLLKSSLHATKREVFYSDVNLFRDQKYSDKIIEDVSSMLNTTRDSVHIVASARGSAMGRVVIRDGGDLIDLTKMGTGGWAITPFLDQLEIVESDAEFILMAEKDAAVMRLAEAKYWNRQPCIVLTGKGSGDIATRAFLKKLVKELEIPAFALVDSDPYGHYIYSVFLRGSKRLSYESPFIATPELKLLGVLSRDLDAFDIPKSVRIPMDARDMKRVREMLKEPFVKQNKEWVKDLKLMLDIKEKAEIQAFASHSFEYLTDVYLPQKLETGDWI